MKRAITKTGVSVLLCLLHAKGETIRLPIGNNKAGFPPVYIPCLAFRTQSSVIRKNRAKSAPIRPVTGIPPKK
jgi:hypothetical protein